jgi:RHS repeat-associated protein
MMMNEPDRKFSLGGNYRYGFNGKENDDEVKGEGNQQDYGMRIYDPRLGRFLSVDPLTRSYPELTPYQFASNSPIASIDLDGLEGLVATGMPLGNSGVSHGMIVSAEGARRAAPKVAEFSKSAAHSFIEDVKSLGKLKTYTDALDFFSLMFVPDVSSHIDENDQKRYETIQGGINEVKNIPNWGAKEWGSAAGHLAFQFLLGKTFKFAGGLGRAVTGTWVAENIGSWSERAIAYQEYVSGVKAGQAFEVNGVKFDGIRGNTLLEAKSSYDNFVSKKTGQFYDWFVNDPQKGAPKLLDQARRQIEAAKGASIEWNFSSQKTLDATKAYFESNGLKSGIIYKYNPQP